MKLSIVITAYKTRGLVRQLLKGIFAFPLKHSFEIILVDNHSQDGTEQLVTEEFPHVTYLQLPFNQGLAKANNAGIRKSSGDYILILNPDIAIFQNEIDKLVDFMDTHPHAGIAAPKLLNPDKSLQYSTMRFPRWYTPLLRRTPFGRLPRTKKYLLAYIMKEWNHNSSRTVEWVLGAAMLIRASSLREVGLQDENFFLYFEDVDWCKRFWKKKWEVWYAHDVEFIHYHRRESAEYPGVKGIINPITKIHIQSWIRYFKKH